MFPEIDVEIGSIFKYKTKIEEDRWAQHYHSNPFKSESILESCKLCRSCHKVLPAPAHMNAQAVKKAVPSPTTQPIPIPTSTVFEQVVEALTSVQINEQRISLP